MKKSFFRGLKKDEKPATAERKGAATVHTEFAKGITLDENFEEMFPGEIPDEVKYYDIHGNEVKK